MPQAVLMLSDHIVSLTKQDTTDPKCVIQSTRTGARIPRVLSRAVAMCIPLPTAVTLCCQYRVQGSP